ncbi:Myosin-VIIa [Eumeta japonica]|uniref:peptidylprolyl isomerase n=1 Tax=Eumeta variegata TaxID=151549 RepID=A0A4C1Y7Q4_EUMVA|nr:Myosin-VIIa [Eumeta japonica]
MGERIQLSDLVWLKPDTKSEFEVPVAVKILNRSGDKIEVRDDDGKVSIAQLSQVFKPLHATSVLDVEDMITLGELQEYTILRNLHIRYNRQLIYRRERCRKNRKHKIVITIPCAASGKHSWIEQQIQETNPILEAFGNAKTVRNDNSSRFGKYINIHFNVKGTIEGANIEKYLLEKSRIVSQNKGERNYHIFYSLLAGISADERKKLELGNASDYYYTNSGNMLTCDGRNEALEFSDIRSAFKVLNFPDDEIWGVFSLLAAILHLGNLKFKSFNFNNIESSEITDNINAAKIANLLGVNKTTLCESLTRKTLVAQGDKVVSTLPVSAAVDGRDALVKAIYGHIFDYIVEMINKTLHRDRDLSGGSIGILDIFGFENFDSNSFEQLCINYANENLQQFFVKHIFKLEQEQYEKEGITWTNIDYVDNQENLDMIGFLDKNRDLLTTDVKELILDSNNGFLKKIFVIEAPSAHSGSRKAVSLSYQFKTSLEILMKTLYACHPFFVRCIKPNELKRPKLFDKALCVRQLRYAGLMETAKIRQAGYPIRYSYVEFVNRYRLIVADIPPAEKTDCRKATQKICNEVLKDQDFRLGHTKVFLKNAHDALLEDLRHKVLIKAVIKVQANARRFILRLRYLRLREAAIVVQKNFRARGYRTSRGFLMRRLIKEKGHLIAAKLSELRKEKDKLERELKESGKSDYKGLAEDDHEKKLREFMKNIWFVKEVPIDSGMQNSTVIDDTYVDDVFGFLKDAPVSAGTIRGTGFGVTSASAPQVPPSHAIPIPQKEDEIEERFDEYNFRKFAATYFLGNLNHQYSRKPLKHSLLDLPSPMDKIAAKALWITILRFMGDLSEPKYVDDKTDNTPVMMKLSDTLGRAFKKSKEFEELMAKGEPDYQNRGRLIQKTLKKQTKLNEEFMKSLMNDEMTNEMYDSWLNSRRTSNLEKLHFIIGHGIIRKELRDEIFCHICKQLSNNPSQASHARGWILLSLCVGCFPPSERFVNYLRSFIREGPPGYAPYCEGRLIRTFKNGPRTQPPSWLELQATKTKKPILLTVTLMDESTKTVQSDSATTSEEICQQIADSIGLVDVFGFSLYITLYDKILSLGSEGEHIMDAISQCEQFAKEQGTSEKHAPWRLFFRKEVFTPWHDPSNDPVATNLIYHQVVKGVKFGEYRCDSENDLAMIAAQQHYIEYGPKLERAILRKVIVNYIPNQFIQSNDAALSKWEDFVAKSFETSNNIRSKIDPRRCKEDIVLFAKLKWPMLFSRFFEAVRVKGESITKDLVIIAVNWTGIYIVDHLERILLEISFPEVTYVGYSADKEYDNLGNITITTIQQEEFVFQSVDASELSTLIIYLIDGLKRRSIYVIAQSDVQSYSDASSFLRYKKGDLITLLHDCNGETLMSSTWGHGICNGQEGLFPTEQVYILPTLAIPPSDILEIFKKGKLMDVNKKQKSHYNTVQRKRMHTLEKYAKEHFRENYDLNVSVSRKSTLTTVKKTIASELWAHSREPLRKPLLKKLQDDENHCKAAVMSFLGILKYMGDMPAPKARIPTEYTDEILKAAIADANLRDEIYCQIMKQLTNNKIQLSEERGWELMWLTTGVFSCGPTLMKELVEFLKTRPHPIAKECLKRVFRTQKNGARLYAPYIVEIEAIQHRSMQIYHKVYFPDDTDEAFEVESSTKAKDLCEQISLRLHLKNNEGFSLFVKIADKVFSVPENYYFFDFVHELIEWMRQSRPIHGAGSQLQMNYQIFFMKKLWVNTIPGRDKKADLIFYYPQELPKYLRGYHKTSKTDLIELAALVYRARFGNDQTLFSQIPQLLPDLIPSDMVKIQSNSQWKSSISAAYLKHNGMTEEDAKEQFLKRMYQLPTFGTAFFEVKQTSDPMYPEMIVIGINKNGVSLIHPQSRDILVTHSFSVISNWSSGNTYFHMTMARERSASMSELHKKLVKALCNWNKHIDKNKYNHKKNLKKLSFKSAGHRGGSQPPPSNKSAKECLTSGSVLEINTSFQDCFEDHSEQSTTQVAQCVDTLGVPIDSFQLLEKELSMVDAEGYVKKKVLEMEGGPPLHEDCTVDVAYAGYWEKDVDSFDFTTIHKPLKIDLKDNSVLPGLNIAIQTMLVGEFSIFLLSYEVMYGILGVPPKIKPKARCVYYIKLIRSISTPKDGHNPTKCSPRLKREHRALRAAVTRQVAASSHLSTSDT